MQVFHPLNDSKLDMGPTKNHFSPQMVFVIFGNNADECSSVHFSSKFDVNLYAMKTRWNIMSNSLALIAVGQVGKLAGGTLWLQMTSPAQYGSTHVEYFGLIFVLWEEVETCQPLFMPRPRLQALAHDQCGQTGSQLK